MSLFQFFGSDLAIDLGTANTIVYKKGQGVVLNESSAVAIDIKSGDVVAVGNKAMEMLGKTPENIAIVKPLSDGIISDFDITKILLKYCFDKVLPSFKLVQPKVVITAPVNVTNIEIRAIEDACIYSGSRDVYIIESAVAAALGAGLTERNNSGNMIVNLGAGSCEIAIVSHNGIVTSKNLDFGGDIFDQDIVEFVEQKYNIIIGKNSARELKENLVNFNNIFVNTSMEVSGRNVDSGMPIVKEIYASDISKLLLPRINLIIDSIKFVLEKNPPELAKDILEYGIFLTGGGSKFEGLDTLIETEIGIKVTNSNNPLEDCVIGAGKVVSDLSKFLSVGK